jgi:hypothetical protein
MTLALPLGFLGKEKDAYKTNFFKNLPFKVLFILSIYPSNPKSLLSFYLLF